MHKRYLVRFNDQENTCKITKRSLDNLDEFLLREEEESKKAESGTAIQPVQIHDLTVELDSNTEMQNPPDKIETTELVVKPPTSQEEEKKDPSKKTSSDVFNAQPTDPSKMTPQPNDPT